MRPVLGPLTLLTLWTAGCASDTTGAATTVGELRALVEQADRAVAVRDLDQLDQLLSAEYFLIDPVGGRMDRMTLFDLLGRSDAPAELQVTSDEWVVREMGDAALVSVRSTHSRPAGDSLLVDRYRNTYMMERQPTGWRIVMMHGTRIPA